MTLQEINISKMIFDEFNIKSENIVSISENNNIFNYSLLDETGVNAELIIDFNSYKYKIKTEDYEEEKEIIIL
jgi:hypothetical protein